MRLFFAIAILTMVLPITGQADEFGDRFYSTKPRALDDSEFTHPADIEPAAGNMQEKPSTKSQDPAKEKEEESLDKAE